MTGLDGTLVESIAPLDAEMIFAGDRPLPDGNDYPAKDAGVALIQTRYPQETKRVIETIAACQGSDQDAHVDEPRAGGRR